MPWTRGFLQRIVGEKLPLRKGQDMAGEEGKVLLPSKSNPNVRRWQAPAAAEADPRDDFYKRRQAAKERAQGIAAMIPGQRGFDGQEVKPEHVSEAKRELQEIEEEEHRERKNASKRQGRVNAREGKKQIDLFAGPTEAQRQGGLFSDNELDETARRRAAAPPGQQALALSLPATQILVRRR